MASCGQGRKEPREKEGGRGRGNEKDAIGLLTVA